MSRRTPASAVALAGGCVALFVAMIVLTVLTSAPPPADGASFGFSGRFGTVIGFTPLLAFAIVGGLVAARRPRNPVGWICLISGVCWTVTFFNDAYKAYGQTHGGRLPPLSDWLSLVGWVPAAGLLATFLLLLFPDGRLPSPRWRPVAWASGGMIILLSFVTAFALDDQGQAPTVPHVLEGVRPLAVALEPLFVLFPACFVACAASLVVRYRRAELEEREKLKWIAYAGVLVALVYLVTLPLSLLFDSPTGTPTVVQALETLTLMSYAAIPVAVGFAVMRYRLYDIDRIISRTLSYAVVTVLLAGLYVLVVLVPTSRLGAGSERPDWLVAVGTLAVAAVFSPVRRRVQTAVDHRFNRRRFDAETTVAAFTSRLREQVDLDELRGELRRVVTRTMSPSHVSVWVRNESGTLVGLDGRKP